MPDIRGPALTYVTDPDLPIAEQKRVIRAVLHCANDHPLRIAFRLPGEPDSAIVALLDWYVHEVGERHLGEKLLPPLIHNRPHIAARYTGSVNWLSSDRMQAGQFAEVYSGHSPDEAQTAAALGAREGIFGHVFATESHPKEQPRGLEALAKLTEITRLHVTAIGGINQHTIAAIGAAGVHSVAMIRAISRSPNIGNTIEQLFTNLKGNQYDR